MHLHSAKEPDIETDASGERLRRSVNPEEPARSTVSVSMASSELVADLAALEPLVIEAGGAIKHYEIIRELGHGGMGRVFLARDTKLGRLCAIKLLLAYTGARAGRFLAEAQATARCKHENIVVIHEVDEIRGFPFAVLEYLEGRTLRAWMNERAAKVPVVLAAQLVIPLLHALVRAHEMGIVHRDLKPENIFLTDSGQLKVLDFGIAKWIDPGEAAEDALSRVEDLAGTPAYMSPEQWCGLDIDAQSDIWATGLILFELLTGTHPFVGTTRLRLADVQNLDIPMPGIRERCPDAGALGAIVDRCLKKHKAERIVSAKELLTELESIVEAPKTQAWITGDNPFAGLAAFQESDAERFFGRERDTAAVLGRLRNQQLVVVAGPSGAGKSSFVRAGVIAALKHIEGQWESFILRPGRAPLSTLAEVLTRVNSVGLEGDDDIMATLRHTPGYLGARLRAHCRKQGTEHHILLFVDQFEELYTLGADAEERAAFIACIEGAADDASSPLRVILSVRSDFLDRMAQDRQLMEAAARGLFFLSPMGRDELHAALVRPLEATGHHFESPDMVLAMLDALETAAIPLPLLQFAATLLWELRDNERRLLTQDSYEKIGGVAGSLATHADAVMDGFSAHEQQISRAVFLQLVTPERTRAVVSLPDLRELDAEAGAVEKVVFRLSEARLLLIDTSEKRAFATVELVHESLIESWPRLRRWLDENQDDAEFLARVRPAAKQWEESHGSEGLLWRGQAAEEASRWQARPDATTAPGLGTREARFLAAVAALETRERRRRRRIVVGVIASLMVIVVAMAMLAFQAKREAKRAEAQTAIAEVKKTEAEFSAVRARNATRMAAARERHGDPTTVLALLREIEPGPVPRGWAELARSASEDGVAQVVLVHKDVVWSATWSPDGRRIASASFDNGVHVWNADGSGEALVLRGHEDHVYSVAWSPDGRHLASAAGDRTVRVWNADGTGQPLVLRGHDAGVFMAAWSPDAQRIASASGDRTVRVGNADGTGQPLILRGHDDGIYAATWSFDGQHIVSASADKTLRVWNAKGTGQPLVLRGHSEAVYAASFTPDSKRLVSSSADKTVRVWNADGKGETLPLRGHDDHVRAAAWSPDGQRIASASWDRTVRVWNSDGSGRPLVLRGHGAGVSSVAWSADGQRIVSASQDKMARVWNLRDSSRPLVLRGHDAAVHAAAWSADGQRIVSSSFDMTVRVWNADGSSHPVVLQGHGGYVHGAAFSPDGRRVVSASADRTVRVWNADGSSQPLVLRGHGDYVYGAAFSPDGQRIVSASGDKTVRVWNANGSGQPLVLQGHDDIVYGAAFSPDGKHIVSASRDKTVRVWNADGSSQPLVLQSHDDIVYSAAFSPDGKHIVSASRDKTVRVWNADGSGQPFVLRGHEAAVNTAAWSLDGTRLVSSSDDATVRIWNGSGTFDPLLVLHASSERVSTASWSPDNTRIVAASDDSTVIVWSDIEPLSGASDPKLWRMTTYCMPLDVRQRLLDFPEEQSRKDLEQCERRVREARLVDPAAR